MKLVQVKVKIKVTYPPSGSKSMTSVTFTPADVKSKVLAPLHRHKNGWNRACVIYIYIYMQSWIEILSRKNFEYRRPRGSTYSTYYPYLLYGSMHTMLAHRNFLYSWGLSSRIKALPLLQYGCYSTAKRRNNGLAIIIVSEV